MSRVPSLNSPFLLGFDEIERALDRVSKAADGTPIMLTDSREAAIANAWSQELETVSVH